MINKQRSGYNFLGILNDLKRRPEDAARDLQISVDEVLSYIKGEQEIPVAVARRATEIWPVNIKDFYVIEDDTPLGVKVMSAQKSLLSNRVMTRAGQPYYEYRDTATSKVAQFRPEWIRELCVVHDNDVENPSVQWNNGHFMHQFTYFVGPVNFYFQGEGGKKCLAEMNTGDSMYITPFVPHTFTTRYTEAGTPGLILALTYGNKLAGEAQQELSTLGAVAENYALDFSSKGRAIGSLVRFYREASSLSIHELANRIGFTAEDILALERGTIPGRGAIRELAMALGISEKDLSPPEVPAKKVVVQYYHDAARWFFPENNKAYEIVQLAGTPNLPHSKSLEIHPLQDEGDDLEFAVGLHQYGYNLGPIDVILNWEHEGKIHQKVIAPGGSVYMKPYVRHNFRGKGGKLLVLRIGGRAAGEPQRELSLIGKQHTARAISESMTWFNKEGKQ